jgi:hypothetical protein
MTAVPYAEIKNLLMTGDILLFHGVGWESNIIQIAELSQWTHVGMAVRTPEFAYPLIWESTPLEFIREVIFHKRKSGARLVSLDERLSVAVQKRLYSRIAVRHLKVERTPEMIAALRDFITSRYYNLPYPDDWEMLIEYIRGRFLGEEKAKTDDVYCAELVAETYKCMGLLSPDLPSNSFSPKDFSSKGRISLLKGAELEEESLVIPEREQ